MQEENEAKPWCAKCKSLMPWKKKGNVELCTSGFYFIFYIVWNKVCFVWDSAGRDRG